MNYAKLYFSNHSYPQKKCQDIKNKMQEIGLKTEIFSEYVVSCNEKCVCKFKNKCKIKILDSKNVNINKALKPIGKMFNAANVKCLSKDKVLLPTSNGSR